MAFIPTANCARVIIGFATGSEAFSNTFHATKAGFTSVDMSNLATALDTWMNTNWKPSWPSSMTYTGITVYDIRTSTGERVFVNTGAGAGAVAGSMLPNNVAGVVTLRTAERGRSARGRVYVAGLREEDIDAGALNAGAETRCESYVGSVRATILAQGWSMVIRSIQQDGQVLDEANTRVVTAYEMRSPKPGTQRRRIDRP